MTTLTNARLAGNDGTNWRLTTDQGELILGFVASSIARVAFVPNDALAHQTWAIAPETLHLVAPVITADESPTHLTLRTDEMTVECLLGEPNLTIRRANGDLVLADALGGGLSQRDDGLHWDVDLPTNEHIFGGGQRTARLDKRGRRLTFWADDPLPNHGDQTDMMYQSASFVTALRAGLAHGIFFDSNYRSSLDVGQAQADRLAYVTSGPDLVAYVFGGPTLGAVLADYANISGHTPPQPRWSLGNQQSRWGYMTADEVREIAATFRKENIPCDAIYLDIDYMHGYRNFTFDPERFANPKAMIDDLRAQNFRVVTIVDPGVKIDPDYATYREGIERGYFTRNADGSVFEGWVWPGHSVWTDYSRADVRAWWGEQHRFLVELGVAGIWDDMNEPSQAGMSAPPEVTVPFGATLPLDAQHGTPDEPLTHAEFHNAYGHEMVRATRDALESMRPNERAFVLSRAAAAGTQRYGIVWNGDNASIWPHLRLAITMNLGLGLSGFPVTGIDIGGFWSDTTPELLVRFTQIGAFLPFCRNHSSRGTIYQEPWRFGEPYTSACRAAIEERYRLLPYLVTLFHEASTAGTPIMRPLAWLAPEDEACVARDDQFLLGNDLLIAPVLEEGATSREVFIPPGEWADYDDNRYQGPTTISVPVTLDSLVLYRRAGSIIPTTGVTQHTEEVPTTPLTLDVTLGETMTAARGTMWDDDDDPHAETRMTFAEYRMIAEWKGDTLTVRIERAAGRLRFRYPDLAVRLHLPSGVTATEITKTGTIDVSPVEWTFEVHRA